MILFRHHFFLCELATLLASGCGAPLKSANDVKPIFADSTQLSEKVTILCALLNARTEQPNLQGIGIADQVCTRPEVGITEYKSLTNTVGFSAVQSDDPAVVTGQTSASIFNIKTYSAIRLDRSLLELAQIIFTGLKDETNGLLSSNQGAGTASNNAFSFQLIGKPNFDGENFKLDLEFNLSSSREQNGNIDVNNHFKVTGFLFDKKYFAATAEAVGEQPVEKSLIKTGKLLIILIPHGGVIYLSISTDLVFHSFGVNTAMEKKIVDALGKGLKAVPDLLAGLNKSTALNGNK